MLLTIIYDAISNILNSTSIFTPPEVQVGGHSPATGHGDLPPKPGLGYIPFVDLPCEKYIGETSKWIAVLSTFGPVTCKYIPWLCCPIPFEFNATDTISSDLTCDSLGAKYGAAIFWTMQAVTIAGLVIASVSLLGCAVEQIAAAQNTSDDSGSSTVRDNLRIAVEKGLQFVQREGLFEEVFGKNSSFKNDHPDLKKYRTKRQNGHLNVPVPIQPPVYGGSDVSPPDRCERDEILHLDGECYQILDQGPCEDDEYVIMDPKTKRGICAARLCSPDRVFVFSDQMCHDPLEVDICPPGRQLFTTMYGTPICSCPDGTYEEETDEDEDVCRPILGKLEECPPGQVYWFTSFRSHPRCLRDPCQGLNSKKGKDEMPYVPSAFDGRCYQLGEELPQCPDDTFYSLSYHRLEGICASLDDAGYLVVDQDTLRLFASRYSPRLPRDVTDSKISSSRGDRPSRPSFSESIKKPTAVDDSRPSFSDSIKRPTAEDEEHPHLAIGDSVVSNHLPSSFPSLFALFPTHTNAFSPPMIRVNGSLSFFNLFAGVFLNNDVLSRSSPNLRQSLRLLEDEEKAPFLVRRRSKRAALPFASPSTVFEPALSSCKSGAIRDINSKCRSTILPARAPRPRPKRTISPVSPSPACPRGSFYNIQRQCSSSARDVESSLLSLGLG